MFNQNLRQQKALFGKIKNAFRILAWATGSVVLLGSAAHAQSTAATSALEAGYRSVYNLPYGASPPFFC